MTSGTPVLCSHWGPLPEIAGEGAVFFNPESVLSISDAVISLYRNAELRERVISLGNVNFQKFSWEKSSKILLDRVLDI